MTAGLANQTWADQQNKMVIHATTAPMLHHICARRLDYFGKKACCKMQDIQLYEMAYTVAIYAKDTCYVVVGLYKPLADVLLYSSLLQYHSTKSNAYDTMPMHNSPHVLQASGCSIQEGAFQCKGSGNEIHTTGE